MINNPIIGVTPLWDDKLQSVWMLSEYMDAIREEAIATYVSGHQIPAKYYQDFGWDAQEIPMK